VTIEDDSCTCIMANLHSERFAENYVAKGCKCLIESDVFCTRRCSSRMCFW